MLPLELWLARDSNRCANKVTLERVKGSVADLGGTLK
jgi:hypothetical protein